MFEVEYKSDEVKKVIYKLFPSIMLPINNIILGNKQIDKLKEDRLHYARLIHVLDPSFKHYKCNDVTPMYKIYREKIDAIDREIHDAYKVIIRDYEFLRSKGYFLDVRMEDIR